MNKVRRFSTRTVQDVPLTFENEKGERVKEEFTVVYRSYSNNTLRQQQELLDPDGNIELSKVLGLVVQEIRDSAGEALTGDDGQTAKLGTDTFADWPLENVKAIYDAIQADIFPQKASSSPGPSGPNPAASEA